MNVLIRTDSKYCKNIVEKWYDTWEYRSWLKPKGIEHLNMDLIERIMDLKKRRSRRDAMTEFFWVKGHAGDPGNEAADKLAEAGARRAYWEKHGRWPIGDRSLPQNRPGDVDFVLGKKVVRRRDGKGEDLVPLTPEELEAQLAALRGWKAKREPVGDGRVGQDKVSKKKAKKKTRQNGK
ncbi:uncharacterized protein J4E92_002082 [Alternaria infectoria]|uniref:uncharacterized protein n=1 Tax=Alternaria infectoria TaxID=45303 RepID=UPI00221F2D5E|nr:uncharacterized protein J4E92_002082 [Alternaria infectoria]KAI4937352.1 hypothetical protein J4E92_002082 [Alternaria infectoria]